MFFTAKRVHVLFFVLLVLILFCEARYSLVKGAIINDVSMEPNLTAGQYVIYERFSILGEDIHRGDIVAIKNDKIYSADDFGDVPKTFLVKRVIGLPGEIIYEENCGLYVKKPGFVPVKIKESYPRYRSCEPFKVRLGTDQYFVMGDNRPHSEDSRDFGPVPENLIVGKLVFEFNPNVFSTTYWYLLTRK